MSGSPAVIMRLVASAYSVAEKAGAIARRVLHSGDLGIVEKVGPFTCCRSYQFPVVIVVCAIKTRCLM